jgi:hypothetical protein
MDAKELGPGGDLAVVPRWPEEPLGRLLGYGRAVP